MIIKLLIEYDGAAYVGWQRQPTGPTIQSVVEDTLAQVQGCKTTLYGSSRTDSGVHARGQVAIFDARKDIEPWRWAFILNDHMPRDIRVLLSEEAAPGFHPQKDAVAKEYEYVILNRTQPAALDRRVYFIPRPLHWGRIREAIPQLIGTHDFIAFQGAKAELKSTVRTITHFHLIDKGDGFYAFRVRGTGFLKQMVRTMAGTLVEIGLGKRPVGDIERILASRDRQQAGHTAPACGLTLVRVYYPGE